MAQYETRIQHHADALAFLDGASSRKIGHNTYVERGPASDAVALRYHRTRIVEWYPDGSVRFNFNGWQTPTTRDRINGATTFRIWSEGNDTYAIEGPRGDRARFRDGMWWTAAHGFAGYRAKRFERWKERRAS